MRKLDDRYGVLLEEEVGPLREGDNVEELEVARARQIQAVLLEMERTGRAIQQVEQLARHLGKG